MYSIAQQLKVFTNEAVVFFSTGKDSIASLSLCIKAGLIVQPVYLYFVEGLGIRERLFRHYEKRFGFKVLQYPQVDLSRIYRSRRGKQVPIIKQRDMEEFVRKETGIDWLVYGYRKGESLERRGMLKNREIPRQFGIADIELNELGMASYFPSLAEALKSALDSNQYMLTRVEDIISKLRGAVPPKMDFDLEEEERRQDPALEAVRNTLEQQEQIEKDKAERRRQEKLAPPEPEPEPTPAPELEGPVEVQRAEPTRVTPEG